MASESERDVSEMYCTVLYSKGPHPEESSSLEEHSLICLASSGSRKPHTRAQEGTREHRRAQEGTRGLIPLPGLAPFYSTVQGAELLPRFEWHVAMQYCCSKHGHTMPLTPCFCLHPFIILTSSSSDSPPVKSTYRVPALRPQAVYIVLGVLDRNSSARISVGSIVAVLVSHYSTPISVCISLCIGLSTPYP